MFDLLLCVCVTYPKLQTQSVPLCVRPVQAVGKLHRHHGEDVQLRAAAGTRRGLSSSKHLEAPPPLLLRTPLLRTPLLRTPLLHCCLTAPWTVTEP